MKHLVFIVMSALLLTACQQSEAPFEIETKSLTNLFDMPFVAVEVTATNSDIVIQDILVNEGDCKMERNKFPKSLKTGKSLEAIFVGPCPVNDVEVTTDQGSWSWSFE